MATKSEILKDWQRAFPGMARWAPMYLARRVGPVVQGLALQPSAGDQYEPILHFTALLKESEFVPARLYQPLRGRHGIPDSISLARHALKWEEAASRLRQQSWLPLEGDVRLDEVLQAYDRYRTVKSADSDYPVFLWVDAIALLVWCGRADEADSYLSRCAAEMVQWKERVLDKLGGLETWRRAQSEVIAGGKPRLEAILQEEEKRHKAADLPRVELIG